MSTTAASLGSYRPDTVELDGMHIRVVAGLPAPYLFVEEHNA